MFISLSFCLFASPGMDQTHGQILWESFVEQQSQLDTNYYQLVMTCILPSNPMAQFRIEGLA